jgi:hypothetical protein
MQIKQFVEFRRCGMNLTFSLLKVFVVYNSIRLSKGEGKVVSGGGDCYCLPVGDTNVTLVPEPTNRIYTF